MVPVNLRTTKMPKKLEKLDHRYTEKLAKIRKDNVQRHSGYESSPMLRRNIQRFQKNTTYDMELKRLQAATAQGHIAPHAHKRVADLKNLLAK